MSEGLASLSSALTCYRSPSQPVIGIASFCNISLGYGLLALASSYQLAAVELDFRMADSAADSPFSPTKEEQKAAISEAAEADAHSLLLAKPLDFEALVQSILRPEQTYDPQALVRKLPTPTKPLQSTSPDLLRVLGEITSLVQGRAQAIRAASQAVENRLDLEVQEFRRQLKLLNDCSSRISDLRRSETRARAERLMESQTVLGERLDKVLVAMAAEYRPQIGEVERKWFDELERLRIRVKGGGSQRGKALSSRTQVVSSRKPMPVNI